MGAMQPGPDWEIARGTRSLECRSRSFGLGGEVIEIDIGEPIPD
jgi:hypothetical protein